ncbi:MAG: sulfite exporter TauE/SafE family protein [Saprospiraceae bacterium]|nr:sulfite exporter TauE/SafE family protein [Saprospiraceae bacterium]
MYWIALTLGFLGSLHCIGMCGPLALAVSGMDKTQSQLSNFWNSLKYNIGRTFSYMILGVFFGMFGGLLAMAGLQKFLSVTAGIVLIIIFLFSVNPDTFISNFSWGRNVYQKVTNSLSGIIHQKGDISYFKFGILNGLLPCGLVYLAIAGAVSLSHVWGSMGFMLFFGLGTFPAMISLIILKGAVPFGLRISLRKLYPIISLILGGYLIYRGIFSQTPLELNFYEALHNPVMCH